MIKKIMVVLSVFCTSSYGMQQEGKSVQDLIDTNKAPYKLQIIVSPIEPGQNQPPPRVLMLDLSGKNLTSLDGLEKLQISGALTFTGRNILNHSGNPYTLYDVNRIFLGYNQLSSIPPELFKEFKDLRIIDITGNPLSDEQIKQLKKELPKVIIRN